MTATIAEAGLFGPDYQPHEGMKIGGVPMNSENIGLLNFSIYKYQPTHIG